MARINIDDDDYNDFRFKRLARLIGDEDKAIGMLCRFRMIAQKFWGNEMSLMSEEDFYLEGFDPILKAGLAELRPNGVYAKESEERFAWYLQKCRASKSGVEARKNKSDQPNSTYGQPDQDSGQPGNDFRSTEEHSPDNPLVLVPAPVPAPVLKKEYTKEFLFFWEKYPQGSKEEAAKRFEKYISSAKHEDLAKAIENYLTDCKNSNRYLKDLSSFIGSKRRGHPWIEWIEREPVPIKIGSDPPSGPNIVSKILDAVSKIPSGRHLVGKEYDDHIAKVREFVGEEGWKMIRAFGGWQKVHESAGNPGWLRSQLREAS